MNKVILILAILILSFFKQNRLKDLLTAFFSKRLASHNINFSVEHSRFRNFNHIIACNVRLESKKFNFVTKSISVDFNLKSIFNGSRFCSSIVIDKVDMNFYSHAKGNETMNKSHGPIAKNLIQKIVGILQKKWARLSVENVAMVNCVINSKRYGIVEIKEFRLSSNSIKTSIFFENNLFKGDVVFKLGLVSNGKQYTISSYSINCLGMSFLSNTFFAEEMTIFLNVNPKSDRLKIKANLFCQNLFVRNKNIYPNEMLNKHIGLTIDIEVVDQKAIVVKKSSNLWLGDLKFELELESNISNGVTYFQILSNNIVFEKILEVISKPSFLSRIKTEGSFDFRLACNFDPSNWNNSNVDTKVHLNDFKIINFYDLKLDCLKYPFSHTIYNTNPPQIIELSSTNDLYLLFEEIPKLFIDLLIQHEDPEYFSHKGVSPSFIGYAFITNLNDKKVSRGGSTITMQLIRNLFLGHSQNLQRKMEEIVLALILENFSGISKERLLEIYLNIIEFGPNIYGLASACKFYFGKAVSDITVIDSIILIYIIPRPKYFLPALLNKTSQLRNNLRKHIENYNNYIQKKGYKLEEWDVNKPFFLQFSKEIGSLIV